MRRWEAKRHETQYKKPKIKLRDHTSARPPKRPHVPHQRVRPRLVSRVSSFALLPLRRMPYLRALILSSTYHTSSIQPLTCRRDQGVARIGRWRLWRAWDPRVLYNRGRLRCAHAWRPQGRTCRRFDPVCCRDAFALCAPTHACTTARAFRRAATRLNPPTNGDAASVPNVRTQPPQAHRQYPKSCTSSLNTQP
jgi:hypothetical protein